jgi:hypothetical protein
LLREVVASMPAGSPQLPALRGALGGVLAELVAQQGDLAMSQEAIDMLRQALASVPAARAPALVWWLGERGSPQP